MYKDIGVLLGLDRDNGKENGNYYNREYIGLYSIILLGSSRIE